MSTPQPRKAVPRSMVRLDEDLHEKLRQLAFDQKTSITRLVNDRVRLTIRFEEENVFTVPLSEVAAELDKAKEQS